MSARMIIEAASAAAFAISVAWLQKRLEGGGT